MITTNFQYYQYCYRWHATSCTKDEEGDYTQDTSTFLEVGPCREESNGKGTYVNGIDGKALLFSSLIQLKVGTEVKEGDIVVVMRKEIDTNGLSSMLELENQRKLGNVVAYGTCLKFDKGRLHNRCWI